MGMPAVAAYMEALREGRCLSRAELARQAGLNTMVVWRLEAKHGSVQASSLAALATVLQADVASIHRLLLDQTATAQDGYRAAAVALGLASTNPLNDAILLAELELLVRTEPAFATLLRRVLRDWQIAHVQHDRDLDELRAANQV